MKPMLISFGFTETENKTLERICRGEQLQLKAVLPGEYGLPVGAHVGMLPKVAVDKGGVLAGQMLLFAFADDDCLGRVLSKLRENRVGVSAYKAVLTPNNMFWSAVQLCKELQREREELNDHPK